MEEKDWGRTVQKLQNDSDNHSRILLIQRKKEKEKERRRIKDRKRKTQFPKANVVLLPALEHVTEETIVPIVMLEQALPVKKNEVEAGTPKKKS